MKRPEQRPAETGTAQDEGRVVHGRRSREIAIESAEVTGASRVRGKVLERGLASGCARSRGFETHGCCLLPEAQRWVPHIRPRQAVSALSWGLTSAASKIAIVEGTPNARILQRREVINYAHRPFDETFPELAFVIDELIELSRNAGREAKSLSVAGGGPLKIEEGVLLDPPQLPRWHNVRLKEVLADRFPRLALCIEHDGNAGALAEFCFGIERQRPGLRHLVFLTFSTGLGAGLIVNGQILHGATDTEGDVGHRRLSDDGPIAYGKRGSWEAIASGAGLMMLGSQRFPNRWSARTSVRELVELMLAGDEDALT